MIESIFVCKSFSFSSKAAIFCSYSLLFWSIWASRVMIASSLLSRAASRLSSFCSLATIVCLRSAISLSAFFFISSTVFFPSILALAKIFSALTLASSTIFSAVLLALFFWKKGKRIAPIATRMATIIRAKNTQAKVVIKCSFLSGRHKKGSPLVNLLGLRKIFDFIGEKDNFGRKK